MGRSMIPSVEILDDAEHATILVPGGVRHLGGGKAT